MLKKRKYGIIISAIHEVRYWCVLCPIFILKQTIAGCLEFGNIQQGLCISSNVKFYKRYVLSISIVNCSLLATFRVTYCGFFFISGTCIELPTSKDLKCGDFLFCITTPPPQQKYIIMLTTKPPPPPQLNLLNPKSGQHQISPCNINAL